MFDFSSFFFLFLFLIFKKFFVLLSKSLFEGFHCGFCLTFEYFLSHVFCVAFFPNTTVFRICHPCNVNISLLHLHMFLCFWVALQLFFWFYFQAFHRFPSLQNAILKYCFAFVKLYCLSYSWFLCFCFAVSTSEGLLCLSPVRDLNNYSSNVCLCGSVECLKFTLGFQGCALVEFWLPFVDGPKTRVTQDEMVPTEGDVGAG